MMSNQPKVGWIGLGVMGFSMVQNLLNSGISVSVFSRTKEKANPLLNQGATWKENPAELAEDVDYLFSMVGYPQEVEDIYFQKNGVFKSLKKETVIVDMTTSRPDLAKKIEVQANDIGAYSLDAPVSGGDIGARNASLAIMCGGNEKAYDETLGLFKIMGENIKYFGNAGSGQRVKMSNQILIASTMIGTVEALLYAERANLDLAKVIELIGQGAAGCWSLNNLGPRMIKGDWEPGFYVKHFIKDIGIALNDAEKMGLQLKGLELAKFFYSEVINAGYPEKGTQVLLKVLRSLNKISL
ncbi:MAG: NAD(P)-dependent oxidoreductase [Opitutae bacterium]|jgi:3-hydroxyisobutyrate dehydrogenase|nr:NAD(P)-dependent oxidoreductase [Opitutae bacterium]